MAAAEALRSMTLTLTWFASDCERRIGRGRAFRGVLYCAAMIQPAPEDYTDEELLAMLNPRQLAELDRQIGEMFGAEGVDRVEALFAMANVYSLRAAERDETSALAMLQLAAAMRRRAEALLNGRN